MTLSCRTILAPTLAAAALLGFAGTATAQAHKLGHQYTQQRMGLNYNGVGVASAPRMAYTQTFFGPPAARTYSAAPSAGVVYAPAPQPLVPTAPATAYAYGSAVQPGAAAPTGTMVAVTGPDGVVRYFPAQGAAVQQQAGTPAATGSGTAQPAPAAPATTPAPAYYYQPNVGWVPYPCCR